MPNPGTWITGILNKLFGGPVGATSGPANFMNALNWARTQVGKPYGWGAVGPRAYDCSGFMSAITNVIRGRNPHSRLGSTATMPWSGFRAGGGGPFVVGNSRNTGGGIGHMAGTLLGVPVESSGGVGVRAGTGRGASSPIFNARYSLFHDGGTTRGWPIDRLAMLAPDERVFAPSQDDYFRRFVDVVEPLVEGGSGRALIGSVNIEMAQADPYQVIDELEHRLRVADLGGVYSGAHHP
jgi:hypothetical protein